MSFYFLRVTTSAFALLSISAPPLLADWKELDNERVSPKAKYERGKKLYDDECARIKCAASEDKDLALHLIGQAALSHHPNAIVFVLEKRVIFPPYEDIALHLIPEINVFSEKSVSKTHSSLDSISIKNEEEGVLKTLLSLALKGNEEAIKSVLFKMRRSDASFNTAFDLLLPKALKGDKNAEAILTIALRSFRAFKVSVLSAAAEENEVACRILTQCKLWPTDLLEAVRPAAQRGSLPAIDCIMRHSHSQPIDISLLHKYVLPYLLEGNERVLKFFSANWRSWRASLQEILIEALIPHAEVGNPKAIEILTGNICVLGDDLYSKLLGALAKPALQGNETARKFFFLRRKSECSQKILLEILKKDYFPQAQEGDEEAIRFLLRFYEVDNELKNEIVKVLTPSALKGHKGAQDFVIRHSKASTQALQIIRIFYLPLAIEGDEEALSFLLENHYCLRDCQNEIIQALIPLAREGNPKAMDFVFSSSNESDENPANPIALELVETQIVPGILSGAEWIASFHPSRFYEENIASHKKLKSLVTHEAKNGHREAIIFLRDRFFSSFESIPQDILFRVFLSEAQKGSSRAIDYFKWVWNSLKKPLQDQVIQSISPSALEGNECAIKFIFDRAKNHDPLAIETAQKFIDEKIIPAALNLEKWALLSLSGRRSQLMPLLQPAQDRVVDHYHQMALSDTPENVKVALEVAYLIEELDQKLSNCERVETHLSSPIFDSQFDLKTLWVYHLKGHRAYERVYNIYRNLAENCSNEEDKKVYENKAHGTFKNMLERVCDSLK